MPMKILTALCLLLVYMYGAEKWKYSDQFQNIEIMLNTDGQLKQFHSLVNQPILNYPGLIIGIEKSNADIIMPKNKIEKNKTITSWLGDESGINGRNSSWLLSFLNEPKPTYVSHMVAFFSASPNNYSKNVVYSLYGNILSDLYSRQFTDKMTDDEDIKQRETKNRSYEIAVGATNEKLKQSWFNSWCAIANLNPQNSLSACENRAKISTSLVDLFSKSYQKAGPTHIFVLAMGWNTSQDEAIVNYNDLIRQISAAASESGAADSFKPFIIGLTWPSQWVIDNNSVLRKFFEVFSFKVKADDTDEVGAVWMQWFFKECINAANVKNGQKT